MTMKLTSAQKKALVAAHEGVAQTVSQTNGANLKMRQRLVLMGLMTASFQITDAGRRAIGITPAPKRKAWRRTNVVLEGVVPLSRTMTPSFPISYASH